MTATILFATMAACGFSVAGESLDDAVPADTAALDTVPDVPDMTTCAPPGPQLAGHQHGDLVFGAADRLVFAPLTNIPLDRSVLFVTVREREASPANGAVLCRMLPADSTRPLGVRCQRWTSGSDTPGSQGVVTVHWSVLTFSSGVRVQHGDANTAARNPTTVTLPEAVDPARSFVLLSGQWVRQPDWGNNEFVKAQLVNDRTLDVRTAWSGTETWWQVVTVDSATVQRGTAALTPTATTGAAPISPAQDAVVLASYTTNAVGSAAAAGLMLDASINGAQLELERRQGGGAIDIAWEVVSLPFFTKTVTTELAAGEATKTASIPNLPSATSVAIASTQAVLGPSTGATAFSGGVNDLVGEASATLKPIDGGVIVERASSTSAATISWTVVDFAHAPCELQ